MILGLVVFVRTTIHVWRTAIGRHTDAVAWDWLLVVCTAASIIYLVVVVAGIWSWGEGGAIERDGRYFWQQRGSIIRELTHTEHDAYWAEFLRVFSAGWLFFALALATWNHNLLKRRR
jgi:hypothetical protein